MVKIDASVPLSYYVPDARPKNAAGTISIPLLSLPNPQFLSASASMDDVSDFYGMDMYEYKVCISRSRTYSTVHCFIFSILSIFTFHLDESSNRNELVSTG